jgi:hypothetical protein
MKTAASVSPCLFVHPAGNATTAARAIAIQAVLVFIRFTLFTA